jgi:hypothetical protein
MAIYIKGKNNVFLEAIFLHIGKKKENNNLRKGKKMQIFCDFLQAFLD